MYEDKDGLIRANTRELTRKVSTHIGIRHDVVQEVVDGLVDVLIDEIMTKGGVKIPGFVQIRSIDHKGSGEHKGAKKRLSVSISWQVRKLWGAYQKGEIERPTKDNWYEVIYDKYYRDTHNTSSEK